MEGAHERAPARAPRPNILGRPGKWVWARMPRRAKPPRARPVDGDLVEVHPINVAFGSIAPGTGSALASISRPALRKCVP